MKRNRATELSQPVRNLLALNGYTWERYSTRHNDGQWLVHKSRAALSISYRDTVEDVAKWIADYERNI